MSSADKYFKIIYKEPTEIIQEVKDCCGYAESSTPPTSFCYVRFNSGIKLHIMPFTESDLETQKRNISLTIAESNIDDVDLILYKCGDIIYTNDRSIPQIPFTEDLSIQDVLRGIGETV
jgi:hypothetical protein